MVYVNKSNTYRDPAPKLEESRHRCYNTMTETHHRMPMAEWSKSLGIGSELEITQVQILSVTIALFISTIDLVLYRLSPLFCLIRSSHRPVAHEGGQNKA
ncbi:hypothetical protein J6590_049880 [Homalodisca vitripennis]|nr:hypothetical protein J6590_049880 [Homalodisca vitripennis]